MICPVCNGKGFLSLAGNAVNAFEGADSDPVKKCWRCDGAGRAQWEDDPGAKAGDRGE